MLPDYACESIFHYIKIHLNKSLLVYAQPSIIVKNKLATRPTKITITLLNYNSLNESAVSVSRDGYFSDAVERDLRCIRYIPASRLKK